MIIAGASPGETKKCGLRYEKTAIFCICGSNNWETVKDRWVHAQHAARRFASMAMSFCPCKISRDWPNSVHRGKKNEVKMTERNAVQDMDIVATEC